MRIPLRAVVPAVELARRASSPNLRYDVEHSFSLGALLLLAFADQLRTNCVAPRLLRACVSHPRTLPLPCVIQLCCLVEGAAPSGARAQVAASSARRLVACLLLAVHDRCEPPTPALLLDEILPERFSVLICLVRCLGLQLAELALSQHDDALRMRHATAPDAPCLLHVVDDPVWPA